MANAKWFVNRKSPPQAASADTVNNLQIPENLSLAEVDTYLASLDDKQARQVLALKLKDEAARNAAADSQGTHRRDRGNLWRFFDNLEDNASIIEKNLYSSIFNIATSSDQWSEALNRLSGGKGGGQFLFTLLMGDILIFIGLFVERFVVKFTGALRQQLLTTVSSSILRKTGRFISRLLLDALGVCLYILSTFVLFGMGEFRYKPAASGGGLAQIWAGFYRSGVQSDAPPFSSPGGRGSGRGK